MKRPVSVYTHTKIHTILFWVGVAVVVLSTFFSKPNQPHWLLWVGVAVFLSSFVYRILTIKCPHCGSGLYGCRVLPKHCPDCGKELE